MKKYINFYNNDVVYLSTKTELLFLNRIIEKYYSKLKWRINQLSINLINFKRLDKNIHIFFLLKMVF